MCSKRLPQIFSPQARIEPVLHLLEQFPKDIRGGSPLLAMVRGKVLWALWDWRGTADAMRHARIGFAEAGDDRRRRRAQLFEAIALDGNGLIPESEERLAALPLEGADLETRALGLALRTWHAIDNGKFREVATLLFRCARRARANRSAPALV